MARFTRANTPLLAPTIALIVGILVFCIFDRADNYLIPSLFLGIFLLLTILWRIFSHRKVASYWQHLLVWSLFYCLGVGLTALHCPDPRAAIAHHGERLTFIARVDNIPQTRGRWVRSEATLFCYEDSISKELMPLNDLKIRLHVDTSARNPPLQIGDIIQFRGRIYAADSAGYDLYMLRTRGISARCFAWKVARLDCDTTFGTRVEQFRNHLGNKLIQIDSTETHDAADIMQALAIGNQSDIDPGLRDSYARTGVAHLLSVSGLHVGIIFMILNLLIGWLRLIRRGYILLGILVILALFGYALLTGLSPAVIRAVIMFSLLQIGLILSRYTNSFNTLCAAALLLLLWNPYYLYHIGFQLSFAAMVGIITLYQPLTRLWMPKRTLFRWLWSLTLIGITAQIGTFPLVMYHFGQLQLAGLLLNPLIWFTVPIIICGSLLYLVSSWQWVFVMTHSVTDWQNSIIRWMGSHEWIAVTDIELPWWICALIYLLIIALIIFVNQQSATKTRSYFLRSLDAQTFSKRDAK